MAFKGLFGECSDNPISSIYINDKLFLFSALNLFIELLALLKIISISSDVLFNDP